MRSRTQMVLGAVIAVGAVSVALRLVLHTRSSHYSTVTAEEVID